MKMNCSLAHLEWCWMLTKGGKTFTKSIIFELYVSLTNMYCLLCIMQSHKMTKLYKIIFDLGPEERKILMEKLQKDESGE